MTTEPSVKVEEYVKLADAPPFLRSTGFMHIEMKVTINQRTLAVVLSGENVRWDTPSAVMRILIEEARK